MVDIGSHLQGTFNQANVAARRTEAERAKGRKAEQDRARDARRRFIDTQEEVAQAQTLPGARGGSQKERSEGLEARDQYEAHDALTAPPPEEQGGQGGRQASDGPADETAESRPTDSDSGQIIDLEA